MGLSQADHRPTSGHELLLLFCFCNNLYRLATVGPVVSALRTFPRRIGVRLSSMKWLFCYHTGKCESIGFLPSHPTLMSSLETQTKKCGTPVTAISPAVKCPMVPPQRYSTLRKPTSDYQPQVVFDRLALINPAFHTLGNDRFQQVVVTLITTEYLLRLLTVQYDFQQRRPHRSNIKQTKHYASYL